MLAIDCGNTQTVLGYFRDNKLVKSFRIKTDVERTSDEYKLLIKGLLETIDVTWNDYKDIAVASVVPRVTETIERLSKEKKILTISHKSPLSFDVDINEPATLGADRIVNVEAALKKYTPPLVIVDCGTAITFDVVNKNREYIGGAITPGIYTSSQALFNNASKLFSTAMKKPETVIGRNTKKSLQSGMIYGFASMIDGMIQRIQKELNEGKLKVIGTGGQIDVLSDTLKSLTSIERDLSLEGILGVYNNEKTKR